MLYAAAGLGAGLDECIALAAGCRLSEVSERVSRVQGGEGRGVGNTTGGVRRVWSTWPAELPTQTHREQQQQQQPGVAVSATQLEGIEGTPR